MEPKDFQELVRDGRGHPLPDSPTELLNTVKQHGLLIEQPGQSPLYVPPEQAVHRLLEFLTSTAPFVQDPASPSRSSAVAPSLPQRSSVIPPASPSRYPPSPFPSLTQAERQREERTKARQAKRSQRLYVFQRPWLFFLDGIDRTQAWLWSVTSSVWRALSRDHVTRVIAAVLMEIFPIAVLISMYVIRDSVTFWGIFLGLLVAIFFQLLFSAVAISTLAVLGCVGGVVGFLFTSLCVLTLITGMGLLLIPLTVFRYGRSAWLGYRHIFYVCLDDHCSYRGLPIHVCPQCGHGYRDLWPSFYGVLSHRCGCGQKLPTFDFLRRGHLSRLCGGCQRPLLGESIGTLPVRLVPIVGGPASGRTSFLLMSIAELLAGPPTHNLESHARLDIPEQRPDFEDEYAPLTTGQVPMHSLPRISNAFALRLNRQNNSCLLYLYEPRGQTFHDDYPYFEHSDGLILLVNPFSFSVVRELAEDTLSDQSGFPPPLDDLVAALIRHIAAFDRARSPTPLAIVITKADLPAVKLKIGDITTTHLDSARCRTALLEWGAGNALRALEQKFTTVQYFACSALGREPDPSDRRPFTPYGVVAPWLWLLAKSRKRG
ncbi:MAG: hypothetical protein HYZ50_20180 [Deltaproteobacteria bacterium]|nr:hypothetical protein [Deltaproteobacteria bacterium]